MLQAKSEYSGPSIGPFDLHFLTTPGAAALQFRNSTLPSDIQVDESSSVLLAKLIGVGMQVYDWADSNGARVKGKVSGRADAPVGKEVNVQWLKLDVIERFGSTGLRFQQATLIQRVLTYGGQAPLEGSPSDRDTVSVPYTALYVFWAPKAA
jgi:hypothetical protein